MQRHKILTLTQTYLTLSLAEICAEAGLAGTTEAEEMLFDMISEGEIKVGEMCGKWVGNATAEVCFGLKIRLEVTSIR
jgi:hypothetical protein